MSPGRSGRPTQAERRQARMEARRALGGAGEIEVSYDKNANSIVVEVRKASQSRR